MLFFSRKNPRAQRHNYASNGIYFVTINTQNREHYFWKIKNKKMILNKIWKICDNQINIMTKKRPSIKIYEYTIMPNHIHILLTTHVRKDDGLPRPYDIDDVKHRPYQDNASVCPYERAHITNQSLWSIIW
jgi:REP element-mobilizing transposase RayT